MRREQLARQLDPAAVGQADVDDRDVGLGRARRGRRRPPRCRPRRRPPVRPGRAAPTRPSRRASWSSTITSLVICAPNLAPRGLRRKTAKSGPDTRSAARVRCSAPILSCSPSMAKDTEKLIRQLSLISYLMAERRPVTALEIRRDVEGYSGMNEDAFARRFYADRSELESLGHPADRRQARRRRRRAGELLAAPGELPPAGDRVHRRGARRRCSTALQPARRRVRLRRAAAPGAAADLLGPAQPAARARPALGRARHHRRAPAATTSPSAWRRSRRRSSATRRSRSTTTRWSATRSARARSTRTTCSSRAASSTSSAARTSATRCASSACRASAARSPTRRRPSTTSSARPDFDPREYANRADWQFGETLGTAEVWVSERIAWQVERHFGRFGEVAPAEDGAHRLRDAVRQRAPARLVGAAASGEHARVLGPPSWSTRSPSASSCSPSATPTRARAGRRPAGRARPPTSDADAADARRRAARRRSAPSASRASSRSRRSSSRPAARGEQLDAEEVCERLQISDAELREDVNVLNVVELRRRLLRPLRRGRRRRHDRGRPRAVLRQLRPPRAAAAGRGQGARRRDRPHRRPPARGRADDRAREDRRRARRRPDGAGPAGRDAPAATTPAIARVVSEAIAERRLLRLEYYKANEDEFSERDRRALRAHQRARGLVRRLVRPARKDDVRHFRLDRIKTAEVTDERFERRPEVDPAADVDGLAAHRRGPGVARPRASGSRPSAPAGRARSARVDQELADGAVVVELPSRARTGSCARCSRRPATPPCSSPPTRARPCARRSRGCGRARRLAEPTLDRSTRAGPPARSLSSLTAMKGLILSGGKGTRLRPITHTSAKQLVPVANRPVLFYGIQAMADAGIERDRDHHRAGDRRRDPRGRRRRLARSASRITYIVQDEPRGPRPRGAHRRAVPRRRPVRHVPRRQPAAGRDRRSSSPAFTTNEPDALILLTPVPDPEHYGVAELDGDRVVALAEKPPEPKTNLALVGVYMFTAGDPRRRPRDRAVARAASSRSPTRSSTSSTPASASSRTSCRAGGRTPGASRTCSRPTG